MKFYFLFYSFRCWKTDMHNFYHKKYVAPIPLINFIEILYVIFALYK